jgi:hypothetical protein
MGQLIKITSFFPDLEISKDNLIEEKGAVEVDTVLHCGESTVRQFGVEMQDK